MGKLKIPKSKQIKGLRKAIANRKTPRQFLPSLKKRLAKLTSAAVIFFASWIFAARPAIAQTPVTIQPSQQNLATNVPCTGSTQLFPVNNRNQTQHYVTVSTSAGASSVQVAILGLDNSGGTVQISDTGYFSFGVSNSAVLVGSGYYPQIEVQIVCSPAATGTFSLNYSGSSAISPLSVGGQMGTALYKPILTGGLAGTSFSSLLATPYGSSAGVLSLLYSGGTGPAGSTLRVTCENLSNVSGFPIIIPNSPFSLLTANTQQNFPIPPEPCTALRVDYGPGGAGANLVTISYSFSPPTAVNTKLGAYTHITGTSAVPVKANGGTLLGISINSFTSGTITIFDLASAACTGTPATNVVAVIGTITEISYAYNLALLNGICVQQSAANDLTVSYQ